MSLTVSERSHWRDRIGKRIDKRVETIVAKEDPTLLQRVAEQARQRAYASLGIDAEEQKLEELQIQRQQIDRDERRLRAVQRATIRGTDVTEELQRGAGYYGAHDPEIESAVKARAQALEADILAESEIGQQVLTLREEKDNLLDTVWLATSCKQIKELWEQVNALLVQEPTSLEEKALSIEPNQSE